MPSKEGNYPAWVNDLFDDDREQRKATSALSMSSDQKTVDAFLANELNQLSLQEREQVYEELHGVDDIIKETDELINDRLAQLEREISLIPDSQKEAYLQGLEVNEEHVNSKKFRLMFLRADYFDPKKAAKRLVWFMAKKLQFFGRESLGRSLMLEDLDRDTRTCLESGHIQLLPNRDRAGRVVLCDLQNLYPKSYKRGIQQVSSHLRNCCCLFADRFLSNCWFQLVQMMAYIYVVLSALEDEETQRRGFVVVLYHLGNLKSDLDPDVLREGPISNQWLPLRFSGIHMCLDNPMMRVIARIILVAAGSDFRSRFRIHEGEASASSFLTSTLRNSFLSIISN